jgi:hypothetical protein
MVEMKKEPKIVAYVKSGEYSGLEVYPHKNTIGRFKGFYIATPDRFEKNYIPVKTEKELLEYIKKGYSIRMSNKNVNRPSTLIIPKNISISEE